MSYHWFAKNVPDRGKTSCLSYIKKFDKAFAVDRDNNLFRAPTKSKLHRLVKTLQLLLISRPDKILTLPTLKLKEETFYIFDIAVISKIAFMVQKFIGAMKMAGSFSKVQDAILMNLSSRHAQNAMVFATLAQLLAGHECMSQEIREPNKAYFDVLNEEYRKHHESFLKHFQSAAQDSPEGRYQLLQAYLKNNLDIATYMRQIERERKIGTASKFIQATRSKGKEEAESDEEDGRKGSDSSTTPEPSKEVTPDWEVEEDVDKCKEWLSYLDGMHPDNFWAFLVTDVVNFMARASSRPMDRHLDSMLPSIAAELEADEQPKEWLGITGEESVAKQLR